MTTLVLDSNFKNQSQKNNHILHLPYPDLPESIQAYLTDRYEGFLIDLVKLEHYQETSLTYIVRLERGNLEVDLIFDQFGALLKADFDY